MLGAITPALKKTPQRKRGRKAAVAPVVRPRQTENDEPQPQVVCAFGFLITNCAPSRPSG